MHFLQIVISILLIEVSKKPKSAATHLAKFRTVREQRVNKKYIFFRIAALIA
jgi:hypothetical protein